MKQSEIEEFEDIFGNVPFENIRKIQKYIQDNYIHKDIIKEKDEETNKYKKKNRELSNQLLMFYKEQDNNVARIEKKNAELEKKEKIIDLMAEQIKIPEPTMKIESFDIKPKTKFGMRYLNKEEVKQYFERKSEK